jgi:hypothetical protein
MTGTFLQIMALISLKKPEPPSDSQVRAVRKKWPFYEEQELYSLYYAGELGKMLPFIKNGKRVGRCRKYVVGMKRVGFVFSDGNCTSLISALVWLMENPDYSYSRAWARKEQPTTSGE